MLEGPQTELFTIIACSCDRPCTAENAYVVLLVGQGMLCCHVCRAIGQRTPMLSSLLHRECFVVLVKGQGVLMVSSLLGRECICCPPCWAWTAYVVPLVGRECLRCPPRRAGNTCIVLHEGRGMKKSPTDARRVIDTTRTGAAGAVSTEAVEFRCTVATWGSDSQTS